LPVLLCLAGDLNAGQSGPNQAPLHGADFVD